MPSRHSRLATIILCLTLGVGIAWAQQPGGPGYRELRDEGTKLKPRDRLNFTGPVVACTDDPADKQSECTVDLAAGVIDDLGFFAAALCGTNELLEDTGGSWSCVGKTGTGSVVYSTSPSLSTSITLGAAQPDFLFDDTDDAGASEAFLRVNCPTVDDCDFDLFLDSGSDTAVSVLNFDTPDNGDTTATIQNITTFTISGPTGDAGVVLPGQAVSGTEITNDSVGPTQIDETAAYTWSGANVQQTANLTINGVDVDFEGGASEGFPRLAQSTTPPAGACDAAGEAGRLYFDTDADTDGSVFVCLGAAGWKEIDDDGGAGGGNAFDTIGAAIADAPGDNLTVTDSLSIDFTTTDDPEDLTAAFNYAQTLAGDPGLAVEDCIFTRDGAGSGGFLCEGTTADTQEQLYLFPAGNGADTTTFIALGASDGDALAGDSATAFFDAGQIEAARGGTGIDTSGSTGVTRVSSGTWSTDAGISHLATSSSADLLGVLNDETGSGVAVFGTTPTFTTAATVGAAQPDFLFDDTDDTGASEAFFRVNCPTLDDCDFDLFLDSGADAAVSVLNFDTPDNGNTTVTFQNVSTFTVTGPTGDAGVVLPGQAVSGTEITNDTVGPTQIDETAAYTWSGANVQQTADLTINGVEVDFESGAAEGYPRLAQSTTPPAGDCDAAAEAGRLYFDTDADTDGSVFVCLGASGWKEIDDDGAVGANSFGTIGAATADSDGDTITVTDSLSVDLTTTNDPEDLTAAFNYALTLAGNPTLAAEECVFTLDGTGGGGFLCEGTTGGNSNEQLYLFPAVDGADTTNFIAVDATSYTDLDGTGLVPSGSSLTVGAGTCITPTADAVGVTADCIDDATVANDSLTAGSLAAGSVATSEILDDTVAFDDVNHTITLAGNPALAANQCFWSANGIICEGSSGGADNIELLITVANPTGSDKTFTIPNTNGTAITSGDTDTVTQVMVNDTATLSTNSLAANAVYFATTGLLWEGSSSDGFETLLTATNPTADATVTIPNATGIIAVDATSYTDLDGAGLVPSGNTLTVGAGTCITPSADAVGVTADCIDDATVANDSLTAGSLATGSVATAEILNDTVDFPDIDYVNEIVSADVGLGVDECFFAADPGGLGGGFVCEGSTADANEQEYFFKDVNSTDTTHEITTNDQTQTLTNKTIDDANNTLAIDGASLTTGTIPAARIDTTASYTWSGANIQQSSNLTINGVEVDFEGGASEGFPRLAQSTTPPAGACDAAGEAGRLYFDTDADTDGSVFVCLGASGWKEIDDDGATGANSFGTIGAATADSDGDTITVTDSLSIDLTTTNDPEDLTAAFNYAQTLAGDPALAVEQCVFTLDGAGSGGFLCEGTTDDTQEQLYLFPAANGADTTTFIALAASDGDALAGDSATAFFDAGQIEAARGGTGIDTSGSTGVVRVASGTWSTDAGISHLATSSSADLIGVLNDETGSGVAVFGTNPTFLTTATLGAAQPDFLFDDTDDTGASEAFFRVNCPTLDDCDFDLFLDSGSDTAVSVLNFDTPDNGLTTATFLNVEYVSHQHASPFFGLNDSDTAVVPNEARMFLNCADTTAPENCGLELEVVANGALTDSILMIADGADNLIDITIGVNTTHDDIAIDATGTVTIGSSSLDNMFITTDSTGDAELTVPGQSISGSEMTNSTVTRTQIDETLFSIETHATDCTALTCDAASDGEPCFEQDANTFYICDGSGTPAWQQISGGSGMTSFNIDADDNDPRTITDGEEALFSGGVGIDTNTQAGDEIAFVFDGTELNDLVYGNNTDASIDVTYNVSTGTDPILRHTDNLVTLAAAQFEVEAADPSFLLDDTDSVEDVRFRNFSGVLYVSSLNTTEAATSILLDTTFGFVAVNDATPSFNLDDSSGGAEFLAARWLADCNDVAAPENCQTKLEVKANGTAVQTIAMNADGADNLIDILIGVNTTHDDITIDATGTVTIGSGSLDNVVISTDGSGDGELSVPADSISKAEIDDAAQETVNCYTIESPVDADNFIWFKVKQASTVQSIDCISENATSTVIAVQECDANADNCSALTVNDGTCAVTNTAVTVDDSAWDTNDWIRVDVGTVSGTPGHATVCATFRTND